MAARSPALLGITRVLIPPAPGVLCADGLLAADLKAEFSRTLPKAGAVDIEPRAQIFAELTAQADDWLTAEKVAPATASRARSRCCAITARAARSPIQWVDDAAGVEAAFAAAHKGLYGFTLDCAVELVTLRVEATGRMPAPPRPMLAKGSGASAARPLPGAFRLGRDARCRSTTARRSAPAITIAGPAIVSQLDATTVVLPGWTGEVHPSGAILLPDETRMIRADRRRSNPGG